MGQEMAYQRDHKIILQKSKCLVQNKKQKKKDIQFMSHL